MKARPFTEVTLNELLAFLAVSHPRAGAGTPWTGLPESLLRRIADFVLEPLCTEFVRWDPLAVVRGNMQAVSFGLRLKSRYGMLVHMPNDEGVAVCGPPMVPDTGIYEVEFSVAEIFSLDGFCRADIGIVTDPTNPHRCGSGIWWEAGDGDVYVACDIPNVAAGWMGSDMRVEKGLLPRWDEACKMGLVVDTHGSRLGFKRDRKVLPFELPLPTNATLHFAVGWSRDTGGTVHIERLQRFTDEVHGPFGRLLEALRSGQYTVATAVADYVQIASGRISADAVAAAVDAMDLGSEQRAQVVAAFAKALGNGGRFSGDFAAAAVQSLQLHSARERLFKDLAGHVSDLWSFETILHEGGFTAAGHSSSHVRGASHLWRPCNDYWLLKLCWCCN